jgi:hypothetical protein
MKSPVLRPVTAFPVFGSATITFTFVAAPIAVTVVSASHASRRMWT